jgi:hypothetical protein
MNYSQILDHSDTRTRINFNQTFYLGVHPAISPVSHLLVFLGGTKSLHEYQIDCPALTKLAESTSSLLLGLEHRFFGSSLPPGDLSLSNLRFLTIEQALADVDLFIKFAIDEYCTPDCRIGIVGTAYSGSLATWFRVRYPHRSVGVWASSAPVDMVTNFSGYDAFIANRLAAVSEECLNSTKRAFDIIHNVVASGNRPYINALKRDFGFSEKQDDISFLFVLADILSIPIWQSDTESWIIENHCADITTNDTVGALAQTIEVILETRNISAQDLDPLWDNVTSNGRGTWWLQCRQLGWFQTASGLLRSPFVNVSYFDRVCSKLFQQNATNASFTNERFGGRDPRVSSAVFTNGNNDPWAQLSVERREEIMGRHVYRIQNGGVSADLFGSQTDPGVQMAQSNCTRWMGEWIQNSCNGSCQHGNCVLQQCVCDTMWDGEWCDSQTHTFASFRLLIRLCILIPTAFLVCLSLAVWICAGNDETQLPKEALPQPV